MEGDKASAVNILEICREAAALSRSRCEGDAELSGWADEIAEANRKRFVLSKHGNIYVAGDLFSAYGRRNWRKIDADEVL
jgi:hypothetical protein